MSRIKDRQEAIGLRKQGKTYTQIREILRVSKSTLSDWLSGFPLTSKQIVFLEKNIKNNKILGIEKIRITKRIKREARIKATYDNQKDYWGKLSRRELEIAGLFLYWGEGNKRLNGSVALNNTDPKVMKFTLYWFLNGLQVSKEKIKVDLHLYSDMKIDEEISFWSKKLNLPLSQFRKPYIKKSKRIDIDQKGFGHGTCALVVNDVRLKEKVMMSIEALADNYGQIK